MLRNHHSMTSILGNGGAPSNGMFSKMKGMFSNFKMTYLLYFLAFILFILVAYYLYSSYVSPKTAPVYNSSGSNGSGSNGSGKEAEIMLFYVDWCPHCKTAKPAWEEVKASYQHKMINGYHVTFTEINCTEETTEIEQLVNQYHIEGYPTIKLVKEGQVIEFDAKPTKSTLEQFLNTVL